MDTETSSIDETDEETTGTDGNLPAPTVQDRPRPRTRGLLTRRRSADVDSWQRRVTEAEQKIPLKQNAALYNEMSGWEVLLERWNAQWIRWQQRKHRRLEVSSEIGSRKRDIETRTALERDQASDTRWNRRALAHRQRITSPASRLARVHRKAARTQRVLTAVVFLGMAWAGVNVQHNLVPSGDMHDPLFWLSYGIEAMISIPLLMIMDYASTASELGAPVKVKNVVGFELGLLAITISLNVGPKIAAGHYLQACEFGVAPFMVAAIIWLHAWLAARYSELRIAAAPQADWEQEQQPLARDLPVSDGSTRPAVEAGPATELEVEVEDSRPEDRGSDDRRSFWNTLAVRMTTEEMTARDPEDVADILQRWYDSKESLRGIARAHGCHHETIGKVLEASEPVVPAYLHRPRNSRGSSDSAGQPAGENTDGSVRLLSQRAS